MSPQTEIILVLVGVSVILIVVPAVVIHSMRGGIRRTDDSIAEILAEVASAPGDPDEPKVFVVFHVYHGVFVWARQIRVEFTAAHDPAKYALFRLLTLNMMGLSRYPGALYVPFLTLHEYWAQRRKIARAFGETM